MAWLVRLKPHEPKKGHVLQRYTAFGMKFQSEQGWYGDIPDFVVEYLRGVHQIPGNPSTPLAFDICASLEEAKALMLAEKKAKEQAERGTPDEPLLARLTVPQNVRDLNDLAPTTNPAAGDLGLGDLPSSKKGRAAAQKAAARTSKVPRAAQPPSDE